MADVSPSDVCSSRRGADPEAIAAWIDRIGRRAPVLELPEHVPRPTHKQQRAVRWSERLTRELDERIGALGARQGCDPTLVHLAAFVAVLHRWSGQTSFMIGWHVDRRSPARPRAVAASEDVLPLRIDCDGTMPLPVLVEAVHRHVEEALARPPVPVEVLLKRLPGDRDPARHPLYQASFRAEDREAGTGDGPLAPAPALEQATTPCDIELRVERGDRATLALLFDDAMFDTGVYRHFLEHCVRMLDVGTADRKLAVGDIVLLGEAERRRQLEQFNPPPGDAVDATVTGLFAEAVRRHADRAALVFGDRVLDYRSLDRESDAVAAGLTARGAGPGACVGVCLPRSIEMAVTVLAVLKSGAAYVPMDPGYPRERLHMMTEDAGIAFVVVHPELRDRLPPQVTAVTYDGLTPENAPAAEASAAGGFDGPVRRSPPGPENPAAAAYVIFTSGSTGRPKGVVMPHRALANLVAWQLDRETFRPGARVLQYASLSFDVSFQELFTTWGSGGTLYLVADDQRRDPRRLLDVLTGYEIERLFLPYVALRQLVEVAERTGRRPAALREVITAGEQLRVDAALRAFFAHLPGASLDNQYGPSETHVVTAQLLRGDPQAWPALPPIGTPVRNNRVYVLDARRQLLPVGATGELYLAGVQLAQGYAGREDLTRERFVDDPFGAAYGEPGARMYRTGDLARFRVDGRVEFLGRADQQIKIRGYRIEPGEIDALLAELPGVEQSLTTAFDDPGLGRRLVSYLLVREPDAFDVAGARARLRERLPEYMVPAAIVPLDELPFTPSGKVDLRALPPPAATHRPRPDVHTRPEGPVEEALVEIWQRMLGLEAVSVDESFFELGGDSLMAVDLFLEIERRFERDLPLSLLAERPTVKGLAAAIEGGVPAAEHSAFRALRPIQRGEPNRAPLFMVHGGGGNVVVFEGLARRLPPGQPLYAFQWDGWNGNGGCRSIEAMAELYLQEMRQVQPQGPYRLGGYCVGGLIALEIARRLRDEGERLAGPLLVTDTPNVYADTYCPRDPAPGSADERSLATLERRLQETLRATPAEDDQAESGGGRPRHGPWHRRTVRLLRMAHDRFGRGPFPRYAIEVKLERAYVRWLQTIGRRIPIDYREAHAGLTMIRAVRAHRPTPYDGDVLLLRTRLTRGRTLGLGGWWRDLYLGFDQLCRGKLDTHFIDASHERVVQHPATAKIVRDALRLDRCGV